ncbi:hypothetical protein [Sphingomonas crusticola]|uniref:hypothetical protein n=1 Tax=Sphingomonas crusticola TaxID=1697973 RepID=UPI0013C2BFE7|nr:hypothetical protein [Sphingomonas crusticola]
MQGLLLGRREALAASLLLGSGLAASAGAAEAGPQAPTGDVHDFDYHVGHWTSVQRRLRERWIGSTDWDEFTGDTTYVQYLGGAISVDETAFPTKGFAGLTVRVFNPGRRQWFIYWIASNKPEMGTPMIGGYDGNRGLFYGDDTDGDLPIKVRFIRTKRPPDQERWEQAFSRDGGRSWETNWTADFTRFPA